MVKMVCVGVQNHAVIPPYSICDPSDYLTHRLWIYNKTWTILDVIDTCQYKSKQLSILIDAK